MKSSSPKTSNYHKKALAEIKNSLSPFITTYDSRNDLKTDGCIHNISKINNTCDSEETPPPLPPKSYKYKKNVQSVHRRISSEPARRCDHHSRAECRTNDQIVTGFYNRYGADGGHRYLPQEHCESRRKKGQFDEVERKPDMNLNYCENIVIKDKTDNKTFNKNRNVLVVKSVKSTCVQKPILQLAVAPESSNKEKLMKGIGLDTQSSSFLTSGQPTHDTIDSNELLGPGIPLPSNKIIYQSFIPRKSFKNKCTIRKYTSQAFKYFIEQNIEKIIKSYKQRLHRRLQLEKEMSKIGLTHENRLEIRKMLYQKESNFIRLQRTKLNRDMFKQIRILGIGAFGKVILVQKLDNNNLYAMKVLSKSDVLRRHQIGHVVAERDVLVESDSEWVVKLYYSFQDDKNLYFVMDYVPGGDLMELLIKFKVFEEYLAKFYIAELVCAIECVHKLGYIHRDIKPDNVLIDKDGHIKLTDFGLCTGFKRRHDRRSYEVDSTESYCNSDLNVSDTPLAFSVVGTPNYIAPEILEKRGYNSLCDWWSLGVILYEMLVGRPPFAAKTIPETQHKIMNWKLNLDIPNRSNISTEAEDLIRKLLSDPETRLANEIKKHDFFKNLDFMNLRLRPAPYVPCIGFDKDISNSETCLSSDGCKTDKVDNLFHGFFGFTFRRFFDDAPGNGFREKTCRQSVYV